MIYFITGVNSLMSSCCFRERSTAWPSPSQTDPWWQRSPRVSWTVSTALRWPSQTTATWTATAKPTEAGLGPPSSNPSHAEEHACLLPELIAQWLPYLAYVQHMEKTSAKIFEAQAIVIWISPERCERRNDWFQTCFCLLIWCYQCSGCVWVCVLFV